MFIYDFPLSQKARSYLKFEAIFSQVQECIGLNSSIETRGLVRGVIDFLDLIDGCTALKIDLSKDLDRLSKRLNYWLQDPDADATLLNELLKQIDESYKALNNFTRQRTVLQNDPIIASVKPRFLTPAGLNCFDTPLFVFWNSLSREEKLETVNTWLHEIDAIRIPISCILNLWRLTSDFQSRIAINGFMQETSETCEFIEIRYPKHVKGYPVVSGFQSTVNVRFLPFNKGAEVGDIAFELAYVHGGSV